MKTKSLILIVTMLALTLGSCGTKEVGKELPKQAKVEMISTSSVKNSEFSNPVLIYGSSFGNYFQTLYKLGKFDDMLKFTSSGSIAKYGKEKIRKMYETMDFAYTMKLKSKNTTLDSTFLNYEAGIYATKHMVRIPVVIENDSVKIVLHSLKGLR